MQTTHRSSAVHHHQKAQEVAAKGTEPDCELLKCFSSAGTEGEASWSAIATMVHWAGGGDGCVR